MIQGLKWLNWNQAASHQKVVRFKLWSYSIIGSMVIYVHIVFQPIDRSYSIIGSMVIYVHIVFQPIATILLTITVLKNHHICIYAINAYQEVGAGIPLIGLTSSHRITLFNLLAKVYWSDSFIFSLKHSSIHGYIYMSMFLLECQSNLA